MGRSSRVLSRQSSFLSSRDSTCCFLAECHHTRDTGTHQKLNPTEEVIATLMEHRRATGRSPQELELQESMRRVWLPMAAPWQRNMTSLPSKRKMPIYGAPSWPSSLRTTSPSLWLPPEIGKTVIWSVCHLLEADQTNSSTCSQSLPTSGGATRCNLRWWSLSFYPLVHILHLCSSNLHCVVAYNIYI